MSAVRVAVRVVVCVAVRVVMRVAVCVVRAAATFVPSSCSLPAAATTVSERVIYVNVDAAPVWRGTVADGATATEHFGERASHNRPHGRDQGRENGRRR
jgi:hypothetical protein